MDKTSMVNVEILHRVKDLPELAAALVNEIGPEGQIGYNLYVNHENGISVVVGRTKKQIFTPQELFGKTVSEVASKLSREIFSIKAEEAMEKINSLLQDVEETLDEYGWCLTQSGVLSPELYLNTNPWIGYYTVASCLDGFTRKFSIDTCEDVLGDIKKIDDEYVEYLNEKNNKEKCNDC